MISSRRFDDVNENDRRFLLKSTMTEDRRMNTNEIKTFD